MNERLKQLAEQATIKTSYQYQTLGDKIATAYIEQFDKEKFAELIIRECLDQCYNRGMNDELYAGQLKAAAYIEEHFGVGWVHDDLVDSLSYIEQLAGEGIHGVIK